MSYAITTIGSGVLHTVDGSLDDVVHVWDEVTTRCGRTVVPVNYFQDLEDYRQSYNIHGRACTQCAQREAKIAIKANEIDGYDLYVDDKIVGKLT